MMVAASAVILAGGKGSRMGGLNKALLSWDGETLIERQIRICSAWTEEIVVVGNDPELSRRLAKYPKVAVVPDLYAGEGPLAGLHAGAAAAAGEYIWLLACDQPLISTAAASLLLARLREHGDAAAAVPLQGGRLQPLHAVYRRQAVMSAADSLLQQGFRKLKDLLDRLTWIGVEEEEFVRCGIVQAFTADMDTPEDFRRMTENLQKGGNLQMEAESLAQRFRRHAVAPEEAARRILAHVEPLDAETVALPEAWYRRLAEPFAAPHDYPSFRRSAMDGYAVRAADLPPEAAGEPVKLEVLEHLMAGMVPAVPIGPGQASRIMTGAMMPEGADTVVMLEMTDSESHDGKTYVRIGKPVPKGRNVTEAGSEFRAGELLLAAGRRIGPGETALLAAFGQASVAVVRQPRVGVLSTGSELLELDEPPAPGKIRNSNIWMLAGLIREAGGVPVVYGRCPDRKEDVLEWIRRGLKECDLLLTTGGVSVGDSDVMADVIRSAEQEGLMLFNKVTMRPGSPTSAAVLDGKLLLALSGNPGACFVGFHLFAAPAIRKLLRCQTVRQPVIQARLLEPFGKVNAYTRFIRSRMIFQEGEVWVRPTGSDQSSLIVTMLGADCLMVVPPAKEPLKQGDWVNIIPLRETEDEPI